MRILLIGIYDTTTVSLAPRLLAALAKQSPVAAELDVRTLEFSIFSDTPQHIAEQIRTREPDVVGFSCYIWNYDLIRRIIPDLDCTIILGGPQVTGIEKLILRDNPAIDIIVTGEGERPFAELLEYFVGRRPLAGIGGITTRNLQTPPAQPVDLATVPPLFPGIFARNPEITWISFETSRGCPMGCGYCTWGTSRRVRYYPLDYVLAELDAILANPRIREIYLCDSSLLLNKPRAKAILDHIIASGSQQTIRFEFSPEQLDDAIIARMLKLPHGEYNFGIQTVNPPALKEIGRPFDRNRFETSYRKFVAAFPAAQITIDLIYGLPGDDLRGYLNSLNYVMSLPGVSRILTNPLIVLPGSRFFRQKEKYDIVLEDDGSFLLKESRTFPATRMDDARRYSFYVNLLYLNTALKNSLLALARETRTEPADCLIDFCEQLPFPLLPGKSPVTIPSNRAGFMHRNRAFATALQLFPEIIAAFKTYSGHRYDTLLENYPQAFTAQYYKYCSYVTAIPEE